MVTTGGWLQIARLERLGGATSLLESHQPTAGHRPRPQPLSHAIRAVLRRARKQEVGGLDQAAQLPAASGGVLPLDFGLSLPRYRRTLPRRLDGLGASQPNTLEHLRRARQALLATLGARAALD